MTSPFNRLRTPEFYELFRQKIENSAAFPGPTTLQDPEAYAGDPLVELAMLFAGTNHDIHEQIEHFYQNLDPRDAEDRWLDGLALQAGLKRKPGETHEQLRRRLLTPARAYTRSRTGKGVDALVADLPGVITARLTQSTYQKQVPGIPAPGAQLAVLGDGTQDPDQIAQTIFDSTATGTVNWVGDVFGIANDCISVYYKTGCRVMAGIRIQANLQACSSSTLDSLPSLLVDAFRQSQLRFERSLKPSDVHKLLCNIADIDINKIELVRRAKAAGYVGDCDVPTVFLDNDIEPTPWVTDVWCGPCAGEAWCYTWRECELVLDHHEFLDMSETFIEIVGAEVSKC